MADNENTFEFTQGESNSRTTAIEGTVSPVWAGAVPTALCLMVALTPLIFAARLFEPYTAVKEVLVQAGTATAALLWLYAVRTGPVSFPRTSMWIPLLTLVFIGAMSLAWSSNPAVSFDKARYLATYILLFAIALWTLQRADTRSALATALVLVGAIEAVYVLLQYSVGDPIFAISHLSGKWQTFGTMGNPNWAGEFLAIAALVTLGRLTEIRRSAKPSTFARLSAFQWTSIALVLMLLAVAATLARGAWLALIVGAAAFFITSRYGNARLSFKSLALPAAVAVIAGLLFFVLPLLANQAAIDHLINLKSIRGRLLMWDSTLTMIRDAPLTGYGLGTFGLNFPNYQVEILQQPSAVNFIPNASFTSFAHNDYLQLWAETGLFGLLAFGALVCIVLKRGRILAGDPLALGCWAAVISILVNALVGFPLHLPTTLMLFVVLVAMTESAAVRKTVSLSNYPVAGRVAIGLVTLALCTSAYWFSYDRVVANAALWRVDAALGSERRDEAEADIRAAIYHAPTQMDGLAMLGRFHFERGEYQKALFALDQAQKLGYGAEIFDLKAAALEASGQRAAAILVLNELVRLRPDLQWPRMRLSALNIAADNQEKNQQ